MPLVGYYSATKAAAEALHETLAKEIAQFGIKVTMIEPGAYATDFGKSAKRVEGTQVYAEFKKQFMARLMGMERGNPEATAEAILKVVDAEQPPLRLILGSASLSQVRSVYADRLATWEAWESVSNAAQ